MNRSSDSVRAQIKLNNRGSLSDIKNESTFTFEQDKRIYVHLEPHEVKIYY